MDNNNKKVLLVVLAIILVGVVVLLFIRNPMTQQTNNTNPNPSSGIAVNEGGNGRVMAPTNTPSEQPVGKLKVANFSGKLQEVNTGCFADGECYVVVDGKHVTAIMGWSQETVGSVKGVDSFGDLANFIGIPVEVYAQDKGDGTYTLYGSEGFYINALFDY